MASSACNMASSADPAGMCLNPVLCYIHLHCVTTPLHTRHEKAHRNACCPSTNNCLQLQFMVKRADLHLYTQGVQGCLNSKTSCHGAVHDVLLPHLQAGVLQFACIHSSNQPARLHVCTACLSSRTAPDGTQHTAHSCQQQPG
jgi:hypothetical protein